MDILLISCLISAIMAEMLSKKSIKVRFLGKHFNIRGIFYFMPIWLMFVLKWNTNPDITVPTGEYWIFFHDVVTLGAVTDATTLIRFAREPLSWGVIWLLAKSGLSYFWMLAIIATFFSFSYALYIDKLSLNPSLSLLFFALTNGPILIGALRQAMSMTFLLIAYSIVLGKEKISRYQWIKVIFTLVVGGLFHVSCLMMLPMFLLANIPLSRKTASLSVILTILISPFINIYFKNMFSFTRWAGELEGQRSAFYLSLYLLVSFVYFLLFIFYPQVKSLKGGKWAFTLLTGFFMLMTMSAFFPFLVDPGRFFNCFIPLFIIIVPNMIVNLRLFSNKNLVFLACIFVFGCYFGRSIAIRQKVDFFYHSVFFVNREDVFELR